MELHSQRADVMHTDWASKNRAWLILGVLLMLGFLAYSSINYVNDWRYFSFQQQLSVQRQVATNQQQWHPAPLMTIMWDEAPHQHTVVRLLSAENLPLQAQQQLQMALPDWSFEQLQNGVLWHHLSHYYWIQLQGQTDGVHQLLLRDVSPEYQALQEILGERLIYSLLCFIGLVIAFALLAFNWRRQARWFSKALPLLARARYTEFQQQLRHYPDSLLSHRHHDELYIAAVSLAQQLQHAEPPIASRFDTRHWLARHDAPAGLLNRPGFENALEEALAQQCHGTVLIIGADEKDGRDQEAVMTVIREQLAMVCQGKIPVARLGRYAFAVLLHRVYQERAGMIAQRLLNGVAQQLPSAALPIAIGIAEYPGCSNQANDLLSQADVARHHAAQSQQRWQCAPRLTAAVTFGEGQLWRERAREARAQGRLVWEWQPIVHAEHGSQCYEMLLRYVADDGSLLAPEPLLQAANEVGLATDIDLHALEQALYYLQQHNEQVQALAVNLSVATFSDRKAMAWVNKALSRRPIQPGQLYIEVDESTLLNNLPQAAETIAELHKIGCRVVLDHFGEYYSSLLPLLELPLDVVKLSGAWWPTLLAPDAGQSLSQLQALLASKGMTVVAEKVETIEQWRQLSQHGITCWQGNALAKPQPVEQLFGALTV